MGRLIAWEQAHFFRVHQKLNIKNEESKFTSQTQLNKS